MIEIFSGVSFRILIAFFVSLIISLVIGPWLIKILTNLQKYGQPIRDDGPQTHLSKAGTPTMGGIMIAFSVLISTLCFADTSNHYIWISLMVFIAFALIGFVDDYNKVTKNHYRGISGKVKIIVQIIVTSIAVIAIENYSNQQLKMHLVVPFFQDLILNLWYFYIPFSMFVIIGSSNAVNLTDGLDGLASGTMVVAMGAFVVISYIIGNEIYTEHLQLFYIKDAEELSILCSSTVGAVLGFLWYNAKPAEIFMGDTGSLALGGLLGVISVILKHEIVLCIIGGIFVIETMSVIIQVFYYRRSGGKRFFLMAPIHHHFEKKGWTESKIVIRFWILAIIFALIGLSSLKLK